MATAPPQRPVEDPASQRIDLRRARSSGGFSGGSSTSSESLRTGADGEYRDLNERVRRELPQLAPPPAPDPSFDMPEGGARMAEVAMAGDAAFAREYRLNLLHRLLMRGISLDHIAREMNVSVSTVQRDRTELYRRLRARAESLNINEMIGEGLAFYQETKAMALRAASSNGTPTPIRLAAIRTALASAADEARFMTNAGVFDVLSFRKADTGGALSDVQTLLERTEALMAQVLAEEEPAPRSAARPRPRPRPAGFKAMTFDDPTASESGREQIDL